MKFGSLFSGIEAASAAWLPLGWRCAWTAEIDQFACAVLRHHYPDVPNLGDVTEVDWNAVEPVDLVVGGPPCQDFSVAGWLSMADNAFGHFLGRLVGADAPLVPGRGQRWTDAGLVAGPRRTAAWRILDAQYFGVPQRRRRVFVLAVRGVGNLACAEALFPLGQSVPRHPAPRREAGERVAATIAGSSNGGGANGPGRDADSADSLIANPLGAKQDGGWRGDLDNDTYVTHSLRADGFDASEDGTGRGTPLIPVLDLGGNKGMNGGGWSEGITPPLGTNEAHAVMTLAIRGRGDSHDLEYRDDGIANAVLTPNGGRAGIGVGAVAVPIQSVQSVREKRQNGIGIGQDGDEMFTLTGRDQHAVAFHANAGRDFTADEDRSPPLRSEGIGGTGGVAVAFSAKDYGGDAGDTSPTLRAGGHTTSHANAGVMPAVAFKRAQIGKPYDRTRYVEGQAGTLSAYDPEAILTGMTVRRLTPRECERLQGFPDDYTLVPYRNKPGADGPRYRALGNSMAVPVMRWLGLRIAAVKP